MNTPAEAVQSVMLTSLKNRASSIRKKIVRLDSELAAICDEIDKITATDPVVPEVEASVDSLADDIDDDEDGNSDVA